MILLALTSIIACSSAARGFQLQPRTIQSQAICSSNFAWADNSQHESPCLVAANVNALCNQGNWIVPALNNSYPSYAVPTGPAATPCTCSWASYNLISACTACQGFTTEISSWTPYIINCAGQTSDTYFPSSLTLPEGTLIPFWAITKPTTWLNEQFDSSTAENISSEGRADVGSVSSSTKSTKSTPIGAIVGGVVGGVVVLLAAIIVGVYLIRRNSVINHNGGPSPLLMSDHKHLRSQSDVTAFSNNMSMPIGYTSLSSTPMHPPTSPTIRTHATSSIRSFPFFSAAGSTVVSSPSVRQQSPSPASEAVVEPFILPPSNTHNPDRKQSNGAYPVYDPPTAPPTVRIEVRPTTPTQGGRTRYNPPAYTEPAAASPEAGGSSHRRPVPTMGQIVHAKKGSADTQHSITSSRSGGSGGAARVGNNIPAMGSVVNQFAPVGTAMNPQSNPPNASANAIPTGRGHQPSGNTRSDMDRKRQPNADGFSARDIA